MIVEKNRFVETRVFETTIYSKMETKEVNIIDAISAKLWEEACE